MANWKPICGKTAAFLVAGALFLAAMVHAVLAAPEQGMEGKLWAWCDNVEDVKRASETFSEPFEVYKRFIYAPDNSCKDVRAYGDRPIDATVVQVVETIIVDTKVGKRKMAIIEAKALGGHTVYFWTDEGPANVI